MAAQLLYAGQMKKKKSKISETEITIASLPKKKQKIVKQLLILPSWQRDLDLMN